MNTNEIGLKRENLYRRKSQESGQIERVNGAYDKYGYIAYNLS